MKSKLKMLAIIVPSLFVVIATAIAQGQNPASTNTARSISGQGQGSASAGFEPARYVVNPVRNGVAEPELPYRPVGSYAQSATFFGHANDWRLHNNEEATVAPIVEQLKNAKSDDEIDKFKGQLDDALEKSFALRQKRHNQEIEELEAKVKTLKELVAKRQEKRREIVANRREQILHEAQGLGW